MQPIIRMNRVEIINIKNVKYGEFTGNQIYDHVANHLPKRESDKDAGSAAFKDKFDSQFNQYVNDESQNADILGFYGQNGSGKTAVFESFRILGGLLGKEPLPSRSENLIFDGQDSCTLIFEFAAVADYKPFLIKYEVKLMYGDESMKVVQENLFYKENILKVRYKNIFSYREKELYRNTKAIFNSKNQNGLISKGIAIHSQRSVLFHKEIQNQYEKILNTEEQMILHLLTETLAENLIVIPNIQHGEFSSKYFMPSSKRIAEYNFNVLRPFVIPLDILDELKKAVSLKNEVFSCLIPGAEVVVKELHSETLDDGKFGKRIELLIKKEGRLLPLRAESAGTLKIFAITSALIAFNINRSTCVVIDELDSGVFEFLLGEILNIFSETGKGQLIFTSHNLRALEVLPVQNIWFTTTNPVKRYIQMKYTSTTNNIRRKYYEAIQLGGMAESVYTETNKTTIKKAFRKAGRLFE
ncbi:AAA family ATPase [Cohnella cellulosilytica]|uniref:AAA family ATPase n=1 Tax=Cohnella cellulosilytica TaxID=986710 RepID=A0ABW2FJ22_9BACL